MVQDESAASDWQCNETVA